MLETVWLEVPCPTCGEYALEGDDVAEALENAAEAWLGERAE